MIVTGGIGASIGLNIGSAWVSRGFGILLLVVGVKFLITS
jgi:type IV secretory pathway TrbD component